MFPHKIYKYTLDFCKKIFFLSKYGIKNKKYFVGLKFIIFFIYFEFIHIIFIKFFYAKHKLSYESFIKNNLKFTQNWFTSQIPSWIYIFKKYNFLNKKINILEIGSYEGLSSLFILRIFRKAYLDCVDPHLSSGEHNNTNFNIIKKNFKFNLKYYKKKHTFFTLKSDKFFKRKIKKNYDFIYVDGYHHSSQVFKDGINAFKFLKVGGLILFDDFLWFHYNNINYNPIHGVNKFYNNFKSQLKIIYLNHQICFQKLR